MSADLEPVGWDGFGSPLYSHQVARPDEGPAREPVSGMRTMYECGSCRSLYVSGMAARECCGPRDGRGWD